MGKRCFADALYEYFMSGCKDVKEGTYLGVEIEHFVIDKISRRQVSFYGEKGIQEILECLAVFYDEKIMLKGELVGLKRKTDIISLEPAGQIEISIAKQTSVKAVMDIYNTFLKEITSVINTWGYELLQVGYYEDDTKQSPPLIPKDRYKYMDAYFKGIGPDGERMMRKTASVHVSIDYFSEEDFKKKYLVAYVLSPVLSLMFENDGMSDGKDDGKHLIRYGIWSRTDAKRVEVAPFMKKGVMGFYEYIDFLKQIPVVVYPNGDQMLPSSDTLEAIWENSNFENEEAGTAMLEHLLSMAFPPVRLKQYIEIRTADSMPPDMLNAYLNMVYFIFRNIDDFYPYVVSLLDKSPDFVDKAVERIKVAGLEAIIENTNNDENIKISDVIKTVTDIYIRNRIRELTKQYSPVADEIYAKDVVDYQDAFVASGANYKGNNLCVGYVPKLFSPKQCKLISKAAMTMESIMEKIIEEYIRNPEYRKLFGFDERVAELIIRRPRYKCVLPVTRVDIFLNESDDSFKLCELNTDGTSAMYEDRQSASCFSGTKLYQDIINEFDLKSYELFDTLTKEFLENYKTVKGHVENPHVVVTDFLEMGCSMEEFNHFAKSFEKLGATAEVCEIRNLKRKDNALYSETGRKIDLIYRRAVTSDLMAHYDEATDFITAVINEEVVLMGDFCTQIVHDKRLFVLFSHKMTQALLSLEEIEYLEKHIPLTCWLTDENVSKYNIREEKDKWILKPVDSYGSHGIYPGHKMTEDEWKTTIAGMLENNDSEYGMYIAQEFVTPYKTYNIIKSDVTENNNKDIEEYELLKKSNLTGLYVYCGKFYGVYSRQARGEVISSLYDESLVPTFSASIKSLPDAIKNLLQS